jgi:hypothetical protein
VSKVINFLQVGAVNNGRKVIRTSLMGLGRGMNIPPSVRYGFDQLLSYLKRVSCLVLSPKMYKVKLRCEEIMRKLRRCCEWRYFPSQHTKKSGSVVTAKGKERN